MKKPLSPGEAQDGAPATTNWLRIDLIIAVCALLISSLASGASWWQARVMEAQTQVLREQLGAQIWPYVSVSESLDHDTAKISIVNDGLGPAVLRSAVAAVDGVPKRTFIDVMHTILGPNLLSRKPHGEDLNLELNGGSPGSVLRAGDSTVAFALTSKRFAVPFVRAYKRVTVGLCYCAIIPGDCWRSDSGSLRDPQPVHACPEIANDLLHASSIDLLLERHF